MDDPSKAVGLRAKNPITYNMEFVPHSATSSVSFGLSKLINLKILGNMYFLHKF